MCDRCNELENWLEKEIPIMEDQIKKDCYWSKKWREGALHQHKKIHFKFKTLKVKYGEDDE